MPLYSRRSEDVPMSPNFPIGHGDGAAVLPVTRFYSPLFQSGCVIRFLWRQMTLWLLMTITWQHTPPKRKCKMLFPTKVVELNPRDNEHVKRLNDPADAGLFHLETWLPFAKPQSWSAATRT